ncbi:hypothetical protein [Streptomyces sp. NPDC014006]|uniref:hypothetical protein n=1 Tax=Streptomyces sp. NPDC014006 TaxID=3364870 RepID=UPI0036FD0CA0
MDRAATVRAATLEALSGLWNAPVRFLGRHRTTAWGIRAVLCVVTNTVPRQTGAVDTFSLWGWLWALPVLVVDRRFAAVRKEAEARHVANLEAALTAEHGPARGAVADDAGGSPRHRGHVGHSSALPAGRGRQRQQAPTCGNRLQDGRGHSRRPSHGSCPRPR